jgi:ActR/RegA family two-component response regulator
METSSERPKLLFVDDDESIRQTLSQILSKNGYAVTTVATVSEALSEISNQPFDILLSDLNIGQPGDGLTVVSAMRRTQPRARTYILTGYPDFDSALEAIRRQVDDYFVKPADISTLLKTLSARPMRSRVAGSGDKRASSIIRENRDGIIEKWAQETERDPELTHLHLPRAERIDHLPALLLQLANRLDKNVDVNGKQDMESAAAHGKTRRRQGYSLPLIVAETRILYRVIADTLQRNMAEMDIRFIIPDLILISDNLNAMVVESLRAFLAADPVAA